MTNLFYFRLLTSFLASFLGKFDLFMVCGDIEPNPVLIPIKASQFVAGVSTAQRPIIFPKSLF